MYEGIRCPLCGATSVSSAHYREHLATKHDLVDDEGTSTVAEPQFHELTVIVRAPKPATDDDLMLPWSAPKMDAPVNDGPVRRSLTWISSYLAS